MRKVLVMFLVVGLLAFVACSPDSSLNEELVNVTISSRDSRSLSVESSFKLGDVTTWKYTAQKADNGLKTGQTGQQENDAVALTSDGKTQQLSQGSWNFKLFGYKGKDLICVGEAPNTTITVDKHTITIQVGALTTADGKGKIVIAKDIKIVDKDGNSVADGTTEYKKTVTVRNSKGEEVTNLNDVPSGVYSVEVVYKGTAQDGTEYTAASEKKYFNVFDNLTTTVSGNIKELTQAGEAKPEEGKVVASVDGKLYTNIAKALEAATTEMPLILMKDATLEESVVLNKAADINLGGHTLTLADEKNITIFGDNEAKVTIENGSIIGGKDCSTIVLSTHSNLTLDNVRMTANTESDSDAFGLVMLYQGANPATLLVKNSILENQGAYGVSTNAKDSSNTCVYVTVENSTIITKSNDEDNTGLLFNVPGKLIITNSTISGQRQGVIVRGGEATISNSTIVSSGKKTTGYDYTDGSWETGNRVPLAALVIGNRDTAGYPSEITVTLDNVKLSPNDKGNDRKSLYVYQSKTNHTVTVTGTINGEYTVNSITNGAELFGIKEESIPSGTTSEDFNKTLSNTTKKPSKFVLPSNTTFNLDNGICNGGDKSRNITFVGELDSDNKPVSTVDVIKNSTHETSEGKDINYQRGSTFTFKNLIIESGDGDYNGIVCNKLIYENCIIKNSLTLYGEAEFINCTFENDMANQYSIRTWGGTDVTFEGCTFNTNGKAILLYGQATAEKPTNLTVNNCVFNDRNNGSKGKAAVEIGNDYNATYTLTINNATVNGFAEGKNTGSKLWANKNSMDAAHLTVTIDGKKIQ